MRSRSIVVPLIAACLLTLTLNAPAKLFQLASGSVDLQEVTATVEVYYQAMRWNRATSQWNFDLTLRNTAVAPLPGPVVVLMDSYTNCSGAVAPDGHDDQNKAYYDVSALIPSGGLLTGQTSALRTLALGATTGVPQLTLKVFASAAPSGAALGFARTLNEFGQPLPSVTVVQSGPGGQKISITDSRFGVATVGVGAGTNAFAFRADGYLPVWRSQTLVNGSVMEIPSPRLPRRGTNSVPISSAAGGLTNSVGNFQIIFPAGAFGGTGSATLTPLTGQTLPALLPSGWSPLQAFWLETSIEATVPLPCHCDLWGPINRNETAALVRWNSAALRWDVVSLVTGLGAASVNVQLPSSGAWALVVGDTGTLAPPAPQAGLPLPAVQATAPDYSQFTVASSVTPATSSPSRQPELVTATASLLISNAAALASGTLLRAKVTESYQMRDGTLRITPNYETWFVGYQRPGGNSTVLQASFPLRPLLLLGGDELQLGLVNVDILPPTSFAGAVFTSTGGNASSGAVRLSVGPGILGDPQAVQLTELRVTNFSSLAGPDLTLVAAFQLTVGELANGAQFALQVTNASATNQFVLARVLSDSGVYGLEPILRLTSDFSGTLTSTEPAAEPKLPGLTGSGQYVLAQISRPQALVIGIARNSQSNVVANLVVRLGPWTGLSGADGRYRLLAPAGNSTLSLVDAASGDSASTTVNVAPNQSIVQVADQMTGGLAPRVLIVSPTDGSTNVPLVASITVTFSKPINPGSALGGALQLLGPDSNAVPVSFSLNLRGDQATLLPLNPLTPLSSYALVLSTNLADTSGLTLAGQNQFRFTTVGQTFSRNPGAQLIIYEPTNGMMRMDGTGGFAQPGQPVTLVNETSGRTATVLAQADGSFSSSLAASVDDQVSVTVVNDNGTRDSIRPDRMLYADGTVGLFSKGGSVSAATENGPMQVLMDAGALKTQARIKIEPVAATNLAEVVSNTLPTTGKLVGAFHFLATGGQLSTQAHVRYPVDPASLGLAADDSPSNHVFALCEVINVDGQTLYRVADTMSYEAGSVVTHSPPFEGLMYLPGVPAVFAMAMLPLTFREDMQLLGFVVAAPASTAATLDNQAVTDALNNTNSRVRPLTGALVQAHPNGIGLAGPPGLQPGSFVARSNSRGAYVLLVPFNPYEDDAIGVSATSPQLPNLKGFRAVSRYAFQSTTAVNVVIPVPDSPTGVLDFTPPLVSAVPPSSILPVGTNVDVSFLLRDDLSQPYLHKVEFEPNGSVDYQTGEPMDTNAVRTPVIGASANLTPVSTLQTVTFKVNRAGWVRFRVYADDQSGNETEAVMAFRFGAPPADPVGSIVPSSTNDTTKPMVIASLPGNGGLLNPGDPIVLTFSEAVRPSATNGVSINGGATLEIELAPNQRAMRLLPGNLQPGSNYTICVNQVLDLAGNSLDQDPATPELDPFYFKFSTPPINVQSLPGVTSPAGSVIHGNYSFTIDRVGTSSGFLRIHRLSGNFPLVNSVFLPAFPRAMTLIPQYSFKRRPEANVETNKPLLVIVGGVTGTAQVATWLRIFDISQPEATGIWTAPTTPVPVNTNAWVAGALLSADPASVPTNVKFSAPRLAVEIVSAEGSFMDMINLQALILGANMQAADWNASTNRAQFIPGKDLNGDGDYVDPGEQLPFPQYSGLFGLETVVGPTAGRDITDFAVASGGGSLVALLPRTSTQAERLQVLTFGGSFIGDGSDSTGGYEFPTNSAFPTNHAFRVALDLDFPAPDAGGMRKLPVALVSGGDLLRLFDLSVPETPVLLNQFRLGTNTGTIFSIDRTGADEYTIGAANGVWTVRRSELYTQGLNALNQFVPLPFEGRSLGSSPAWYVAASGNQLQVAVRPPHLAVVAAPSFATTNVAGLIAAGADAIRTFLGDVVEPGFLVPVVQRNIGTNCPEGLFPPNPVAHHYVLIQASGDLGPTLQVAVESLDALGHRLAPHGLQWPPVMLSSNIDQLAMTAQQPAVQPLIARRLGKDPTNEFYNIFVTDPFVLVREPLTATNNLELPLIDGRQAIWSGNMLRVSLEGPSSSDPALGPYLSRVTPTPDFQVGVSRTYRSLPGDFTGNPNPSLAASPTVAGVNLQSGAYRTKATDLYVAGRSQPLVLTRSYDSRSQYFGRLGRGWDFNWNAHLVEIPPDFPIDLCWMYYGTPTLDSSLTANDVLLVDGNGGGLLFKRIPTNAVTQLAGYTNDPAITAFGWNNAIDGYYQSPAGEFSVLYHFQDGGWVTVAPNGVRTYFRADGRLDRVVGAFEASQLTCFYRNDGKLDLVTGDRDAELRFGYYVLPGSLESRDYDRLADASIQVGLIARVQVKSLQGITEEVSYTYNETNGTLTGVSSGQGSGTQYGYDANPPYQLTSVGRGDGAQFPCQRIQYTNGLVGKITQDGQDITFSGAKQTAAERYATTNQSLTVKFGDSPAATYNVDNRGRPLSFANLTNTADDAGRLAQVANAETKSVMLYDTNNAVYRFRGNLVGTRQANRPSFSTSFVYDGSAWNRLVSRASAEGVITTNTFVTVNGVVTEMDEVTGPITKRSSLNEYGQVLKEQLEDADASVTPLVRNIFYAPGTHLPSGEQLGSSATADFTQHELGGFDSFGAGELTYSNSYNDDRQLSGLMPQGTNAPGVSLTYSNGLVSSEGVSQGNASISHDYTYDPLERSRVLTVTGHETGLLDSSIQYGYDNQGRLKTVTENGEQTTLVYSNAQVTERHGPGFDRVVTYQGALPKQVVEQGVTATFTYDSEQRVKTIVQQGATNTFGYNLGNQVASKTITSGSDTLLDESYTYDGAGRVETIESGGGTRKFEYFPDGQLRRLTLDTLVVEERERDDSGRLTKSSVPGVLDRVFSDPDAATSLFKHEDLHRYSSASPGYRNFSIDRTYDAFGRELTEKRPCGTWTSQYDGFGHLVRRTDPDSVTEGQDVSPGGLPLQTYFSDGTSVIYGYDANRRLQTVGNLGYGYNSTTKLLESITWPDTTTSTFGNYDSFVRPEQVTHGSIRQVHTWEDGRLRSVVSGTDTQEYDYDGLGRPLEIRFNGSKVDFTYNDAGQLDSDSYTPFGGNLQPFTWGATFTNGNRLASETYPSGFQLDWMPNAVGLPVSSQSAGIQKIEWLGPELLTAVSFTNGLRIVRDYDDSERNWAVRYLSGSLQQPTTNAAFVYQLSPGGRILSEFREHEGRADVYKRNSNLKGMRIVGFYFSATDAASGSGAEDTMAGLSFDSNGELLAPTNTVGADARALAPSYYLVNGRASSLGGMSVGYNDRGSVSQVPVWVRLPGQTNLTAEPATLTYDGFDMLQKVERGSGAQLVTVTYTRDGLGRIVQRTVSGPSARCHPGTRIYTWKGNQLLEEYDLLAGQPQLLRRYIYIGSDLVLVQSATTAGGPLRNFVPLVSLNGSVGGYLGMDGSLQELIVYGAYGTPVFRTGQPGAWSEMDSSGIGATVLFQGAWFDEETGLYQVGQRNLHPVWGRFLQRDSHLYASSRALYAAFNGDPAGIIDPSGALPADLQKLSDIKDALVKVKDKTLAFNQALMKERNWEPRKETAIAKAGLDLTQSLFNYAEKFNDENFAQFSKSVTGSFDKIQSGLDIAQEFLDWRKDRLILTAIRANTEPFGKFRFETRWLAAGGSLADLSTLDANFFAEKEVEASRHVLREKGVIGAFNHYEEAKDNYLAKREAHLYNFAKTGLSLASAYLESAYKGDQSKEVQVAREVLEGSKLLLEGADTFRKVTRNAELAKMTFSLGEVASAAGAQKLFGVAGNLQAAFNFGFDAGQYGILMLSDPWTAKAYKEAVSEFKANGGWLSVFGGVLETAGMDQAAYRVQKLADSGWKGLLGDPALNYLERISQPDPRWEMYRRALNAP